MFWLLLFSMRNRRFGTWPGTMQAAHWGKREKFRRAKRAQRWPGEGERAAEPPPTFPLLRLPLGSLRSPTLFSFCPNAQPGPRLFGTRLRSGGKRQRTGRIAGSPSSKYEHWRGIGIVIRNASREGPDRLLFFCCAAFILY